LDRGCVPRPRDQPQKATFLQVAFGVLGTAFAVDTAVVRTVSHYWNFPP